ncbi:hypothetical protein [Pseudalkalibacillus berkeleyi]|uniref:DUF4358 domain-containing protein n=1 Tax=Pseudalkalibacillus berkeleyi TaxID=1069813 RepID=A0ABS9H526_9BACL|nr:hypothetical protein [Pseudalkalibacillus berkeleyi]MCF6139201.1 hypothetical protein [Pseudalkalibacillus berkeleyi]
MRKQMTFVMLLMLILTGCSLALTNDPTQQAIDQFTPQHANQYHIVVFYDQEPPEDKDVIKEIEDNLASNNISSQVTYQKVKDDADYSELLDVTGGDILVFDYDGIKYNSVSPENLLKLIKDTIE